MALVWKEQYFDRGLTGSSSGIGRTRGWNVTGGGPDVVAVDGQAPQFGDTHPDQPGLVVNNVSFLPTGFGTRVIAQYVPKEFQDQTPPENQDDDQWTGIDTTFEDVDVEIPVFQLVTKEFPTTGGGTQTLDVWQPVEQKATFRYARIVHRVTLNAMVAGGGGIVTALNIAQAVHEQTNKLHTIAGKKYLFTAERSRRTKINLYPHTYRWAFDPGIPNTIEFDTSAGPNLMLIGSLGFPYANPNASGAPAEFTHPTNPNGYIIPPYYRMDTAPDGTDPTQPPVIKFSKAYLEDPAGYLTLPGAF